MNHSRSRSGMRRNRRALLAPPAPVLAAAGSSAAKRLRKSSSTSGFASRRTRDSARGAATDRRRCAARARAPHRARLHALHAVGLDRLLDLARVIGGVLDDVLAHLLLAAPEQQVVAREVRVTEHVRGDQDVLREAVARGQIGVARVAGKHHLEQARVPHVALDELIDVAHAERPVRHAHRQPVDGDLHHEAVGHRLEVDRVELEARAAASSSMRRM